MSRSSWSVIAWTKASCADTTQRSRDEAGQKTVHGLCHTKQTMPHFVLLLLDQLFGVRNNVQAKAVLPIAERWQCLE